ncbi:hypothetical protein WJX72_003437 [[Myrmecia] bisecta]|uniref:Kinetochore protein Spc24 n=1 Tax=[Myrmecia] bisecta TaxID=41462 RepID=A0AAW1R5V2_9CHLO
MDQVKQSYGSNDDAKRVLAIGQLQEGVQELCNSREEQASLAIRALTERVHQTALEATPPEPEGAHAQRVARLERLAAEAKENIDELNMQSRDLQAQREGLKVRSKALRNKSDRIEEIVTESEPRTRHELSLYVHISKVAWQLDQTERIRGSMSDPACRDIRQIDIDPNELSTFDAVNRIWDIID